MNYDISTSQKTIIFVLGMHRSGTSLMTKAVEAIGANLGNHLMPAEHSNPKGYWEDLDVFHFNERLLDFIDMRWDTPSVLANINFNDNEFNTWKREAIQLLRMKVENHELLAIKDPRISLLIPFWETVANAITTNTHYVIAIRNPLDVSKSLFKRNEFNEQRSLILWINYNYKLLLDLCSFNASVIFIDYQTTLDEPLNQLSRLSQFISGEKVTQSTANSQVYDFISSYIDKALSHSYSTKEDLNQLDYSLPGLIDIYQCLDKLTQEQWSKESALRTLKKLPACQLEAYNYRLQLGYFKKELKDKLDLQRQALEVKNLTLIERKAEEKDSYYQQIIEKKDLEFNAFVNHFIDEKEHETKQTIKNLVDQNEHNFQQLRQELIDENNKKSDHMNRLLEANIQELENCQQEQNNIIEQHNNTISRLNNQHKQELEQWGKSVDDIHASYSWKITAPFRLILNIIHNPNKL